jgi:hypothetical protein
VLEFLLSTLVEQMEDSGIALHDVVAGDRHAVSLIEWWAVLDDRRMDGREVGVFHVRGGRIAEAWFMTEDRGASDAFFSSWQPGSELEEVTSLLGDRLQPIVSPVSMSEPCHYRIEAQLQNSSFAYRSLG